MGCVSSVGLTIFVLILIVEHGEIGLVTTLGDVVVFDSFQHGTSRFVGVGTVGELALLGELKNLLEIAGQLLALHVKRAKALDTRRIDEPGAGVGSLPVGCQIEWYHFRERGGMHTCIVGIADFCSTQVNMRHQPIDQRRLPYTGIAAEQCYLAIEQRAQGIQALATDSRDGETGIANGFVELHHHLLIVQFVSRQEVGLVEYKEYGHAIGFCRSQKTVDECCRSLRLGDRDDQESLIDVSRQDMALLGEVDAFADDVVAAVLYLGDKGSALGIELDVNPVADGHGIGTPYAAQTEVTLDFAIDSQSIVREDGVPTAGILDDETFQSLIICFDFRRS